VVLTPAQPVVLTPAPEASPFLAISAFLQRILPANEGLGDRKGHCNALTTKVLALLNGESDEDITNIMAADAADKLSEWLDAQPWAQGMLE
jgi:hypothetical protein